MNDSFQIIFIILSYLCSFFSTYIVFDFMSKFGRIIYKKKYIYVISYLLFTLLLIISSIVFQNGIIHIIISWIFIVIAGYFLYNNSKVYILYYSLFFVLLLVWETIISYIINILLLQGIINFYSNEVFLLTSTIILQISKLIASRFFIIFYKKKNIKNLNKVQFFSFLILPIFSIIYVITLTMYIQVYLSFEDWIFLFFNIVSIVFLNIFITKIFESISKNNEMKNELLLYEQQANLNYEYYNSLENKYKNSRKIIHDIKNHLQTIESLYKDKEETVAASYTEDLYKIFNKLEQRYYTYNKVLNIILNDKIEFAEKFGVKLDCKIGDVELDFIKDIDLTTIFTNLLDNAIDEVKEFDENKEVYLKVDKFNDFLVINTHNDLKSKPLKDGDKFKTTKKNHSGLGLQNVKVAIEKYNGNMKVNFEDKCFKVNIVIPMDFK